MPSQPVQTLNSCPLCSGQNEAHVRFCVHCGQRVGIFFPKDCPNCGSADELNGPFCVSCGAPTSTSIIDTTGGNRFSWSDKQKTLEFQNRLTVALDKKLYTGATCPTWQHAAAMLAGIVCGALIAFALRHDNAIERAMVSSTWPRSGLVVYTKEPFARFSLTRLTDKPDSKDDLSSKQIVGVLGSTGSISIPTLSEGNYILRIEDRDKKSLAQSLKIVKEHPTICGFPNKICLPEEVHM